jgi:co-chaperonin GroES (HSP10)
MKNTSGLTPLGRAVLVRMTEIEELKAESIVIPDHIRANSAVMETRCEVIAVGEACWSDEPAPRAKPGDKVIITKLAGYVATGPKDKSIYRLVNDRDIFCRIEEN